MIEQSCHEVRVDFISAWQQSTLNAPHNYSNSAFCISLQHEQFHLTAFHGYHVVKNFCFYLLLSKTSLQQQRKVMDHYFPRGTHKGNWKHQIIFRKPRNRSLGGRFLNWILGTPETTASKGMHNGTSLFSFRVPHVVVSVLMEKNEIINAFFYYF